MAANVETALEIAGKLRDFYEKVEKDSGVPQNLKTAVAEGFVIAVDGLTEKALEHYFEHDRSQDRKRLIPLQVALNLIQKYEAKLVEDIVLDPFQLAFANLKTGRALIGRLGELFKLITQGHKFLAYLFGHLLQGAAVSSYGNVVVRTVLERGKICAEMRRRALPQASKNRVRRRKRAR